MICVPSGEAFSRSRVVSGNGRRWRCSARLRRGNPSWHRGQIRRVPDFAGRVTFEAEQRVVASMPSAVVIHADEAASAAPISTVILRGPRVERVFDQFLYDARGPLDHFAGGDLVGDLFGKQFYPVHWGKRCCACRVGVPSRLVSNNKFLTGPTRRGILHRGGRPNANPSPFPRLFGERRWNQ